MKNLRLPRATRRAASLTRRATVATIRIYQLVGDLNWGAATAYTVADIGMAILALLIFAALARGRLALGAARG